MNEIAASIVNKNDKIIGIIPAGTGNDYIPVLGFPERFKVRNWEIFFEKNLNRVDAGIVNGKIFLNGMGIGFDAEVAAENYVEPGKIKMGSKHKYIWHIVKNLLFFKERAMSISIGDRTTQRSCFINTVGIGRRYAGGFFLTPKAIANDGLLDICSIKELSLFQRFRLLLKVPKGTHLEDKRVEYYQTDQIIIEFAREAPYHCDGEVHYASKMEIKILPSALNIIYNPYGDHYLKK